MALLDDPKRLAEFRASLLSLKHDAVLQECVERAARQSQAPMAMISFVMRKIQLFRAAVGLPEELAATRATLRSESYCQFVVESEAPFLVTDGRHDSRLPRQLVEAFGIASYAGVPIRVHGQVLGSLCVAARVPRQWTSEVVARLTKLAAEVAHRLEDVADQNLAAEEITIVPTKNLAARASLLAQAVHRSLAEVGPIVQLAKCATSDISADAVRRAGRALGDIASYYEEVMNASAELCAAMERVEESVIRRIAAEAQAS